MIGRYTTPEMSAIWSDANKFEQMFRVEDAHMSAMERHGVIPAGASSSMKFVEIDTDEISAIEKVTRHDVAAFVDHVGRQIGEDSVYMHRGLTSSDVVDTALALQLTQAGDYLCMELYWLCEAMTTKALENRSTWTIGRSHGMHAEPTSFGLVLLGHAAEMRRALDRMKVAFEDVKYGTLSGPVGVYSGTSIDVEKTALSHLGLKVEVVPTQVIPRDRHAAVLQSMNLVASAIDRMATNFRHLQRTEVGEVYEQFHQNQKGSSAMPHKRNPITSENLCGLSRLINGYTSAIVENISLWHERDISHSSVERVAIPDATTVLHYMLRRATGLVNHLVVNKEKMLSNLENSMPMVASGHFITELTKLGMPRDEAYSLVQLGTLGGDASANEKIRATLGSKVVDECLDYRSYIGNVEAIMNRASLFTYTRVEY